MSDQISAGLIKGKVIEQRAKLRRNLVSRLFRLGNAIQTQTQQLLSLTSDLSVVQFRILLRLRQAGTQNVQGISELLGANRSLVSRALPELRDRGWVALIKSEED
ncbi:MAG: MarR family transcriptional regulator, partial [Alphaproteobacteria bacterium]